MKVVFVLEGGRELDRKLSNLPNKVAKTVVRQAVRAAQKVALAAVKASTLRLPISARRHGAMRALIAKAWQLRAPKKQVRGSYALHVQLQSLPEFISYRQGAHTKVNFAYRDKHGAVGRKIGAEVGRSWIPAAIEYGHGPDKARAARPFARPAAVRSALAVVRTLIEQLRAGIEKAAQEKA